MGNDESQLKRFELHLSTLRGLDALITRDNRPRSGEREKKLEPRAENRVMRRPLAEERETSGSWAALRSSIVLTYTHMRSRTRVYPYLYTPN